MWVVPSLLALRVYCPRQINFCRPLISRVGVRSAFAAQVLHHHLGIMGNKLFIFFYILNIQPTFTAVEKTNDPTIIESDWCKIRDVPSL